MKYVRLGHRLNVGMAQKMPISKEIYFLIISIIFSDVHHTTIVFCTYKERDDFPWKRISYIVGGKCRWILIRKSIQIQPYCSDHLIDTTISYLSSDLWFSHAFTSPINPRKRRFNRYLHQILTNGIELNTKQFQIMISFWRD